MTRIVVAGALGRMGQVILRLALKDSSLKIVGGLEHPSHPGIGQKLSEVVGVKTLRGTLFSDPVQALKGADVLIDFTHPSATRKHLQASLKAKAGYVIGTTGFTKNLIQAIDRASKKVPIVQSPNMSIGVNLLFRLAEITSKALDEGYDIEIVEAHHRMKKDAPSGTALKLLEVVSRVRRKDIRKNTVYGREGEIGARPKGQIGVSTIRGGDVVGDHTVSFLGMGERIELSHRASSREAFAQGALEAAKFISKRRKGLFNMRQVLGID